MNALLYVLGIIISVCIIVLISYFICKPCQIKSNFGFYSPNLKYKLPEKVFSVYVGGTLGPIIPGKTPYTDGLQTNMIAVQNSGLNMIIFGLCHLGRGNDPKIPGDPVPGQQTGDIVFNNTIIISERKLVNKQAIKDWNLSMKKLYNSNSSWYFSWSFGGSPGVFDFQVIYYKFYDSTTKKIFKDSIFYKNMKKLYDTFQMVRCVDIDCEEFYSSSLPDYDWQNVCIAFADMCQEIGFDVSIAPAGDSSSWLQVIKNVSLSHINLQGYAGGTPAPSDALALVNSWKDFNIPIIYGFNSNNIRSGSYPATSFPIITTIIQLIKNKIRGTFFWQYNNKEPPYWKQAINKGGFILD